MNPNLEPSDPNSSLKGEQGNQSAPAAQADAPAAAGNQSAPSAQADAPADAPAAAQQEALPPVLPEDVAELRKNLHTSQKAYDVLEDQVDELQELVSAAQKDTAKIRKQRNELQIKRDEYHIQRDEYRTKRDEIRTKYDELSSKQDILERQNTWSDQLLQVYRRRLVGSAQSNADITTAFQEIQAHVNIKVGLFNDKNNRPLQTEADIEAVITDDMSRFLESNNKTLGMTEEVQDQPLCAPQVERTPSPEPQQITLESTEEEATDSITRLPERILEDFRVINTHDLEEPIPSHGHEMIGPDLENTSRDPVVSADQLSSLGSGNEKLKNENAFLRQQNQKLLERDRETQKAQKEFLEKVERLRIGKKNIKQIKIWLDQA